MREVTTGCARIASARPRLLKDRNSPGRGIVLVMKSHDTTRPLRERAAAQPNSPEGCVEVLGGNELRTEALAVAGLELLLVARPAGASAGCDLYCVHSCEHRRLAKVVLLDITGHGERSASVARATHRLLHLYSTETKPGRLLDLLNRQFGQFAQPGILAASVCAVYESGRGEFCYAYGGQPRILLWRARELQWVSLTPLRDSACGLPFGVTASGCYDEQSLSLEPDDTVLVFSDGASETRSATGAWLQSEGVLRLAQESPQAMSSNFPLAALAQDFLSRLEHFRGGPDFQDDTTLLWMRRMPAADKVEAPG